jgi:hypothetical protein
MKLKPWNYDTFEGEFEYSWWDKSSVSFSLDPEGKVFKFNKDGVDYELIREKEGK